MKQTPYNAWPYPDSPQDEATIPSHVEGFILPIDAAIAQLQDLIGIGSGAFDAQVQTVKWYRGEVAHPDADQLTDRGVYSITGASMAQNLPAKSVGTLWVHGSNNYLMQTFQEHRSGVLQQWVRRRASGVWESWQPMRWANGNIQAGQDANLIRTDGVYFVGTTLANWPSGRVGVLEVFNAGTHQRYTDNLGKIFTRVFTGGAWGAWEGVSWVQGYVPKGADLDTYTRDGLYHVATTVTGNPDGQLGDLEVMYAGTIQRYTGRNNRTYTRVFTGGAWGAWETLATKAQLDDTKASSGGGAGSGSVRRAGHAVRLSRAVQLIGKRKSDRAQVALIYDHGTVAFRDVIFPKLQELGLTCTLAVNAGRLDPGYAYLAYEIQDWAPLKTWYDRGIEIANHGKTHRDWDTLSGVTEEIQGGADALEAAMGRPIHSWVQPGAIGNLGGYLGFTNGNSYPKYWSTEAGALILENHAFATGTVYPSDRHYRLAGEAVIGAHGFWLDAGEAQIETAKAAVADAVTRKTGVLWRAHPQSIGSSASSTTVAQTLGYLEWLASERDAGRVDVVTFAQWNLTEIVKE